MIVDKEIAFERAAICNSCPELFKPTWTCKKCGCFMKVKTRVSFAECPLGKWGKVSSEDT
jgi:hypothetical protein